MFTGYVILLMNAAAWCDIGYLLTHASALALVWPPLISLLLLGAAYQVVAKMPARSPAEKARIGKLVGRWTLFEGAGAAMMGAGLSIAGLPAFIPAGLAIIVGLHFLPLARGLKLRVYYGTGLSMISAGLLSLGAPSVFGTRALCLVCGAVLWLTSGCRAWVDWRRTPRSTTGAGAR